MNLLRPLIHAYLYIPYCFQKLTGTGPFCDQKAAVFVPTPVTPDDNGLKKSLFKHYTRQYHESSCSVASVVTVVNTLRTGSSDAPRPITQLEILEKVRIGYWKERMSENGHNGKRGLPLALLGQIVKGSLAAYGLKPTEVETVPATGHSQESAAIKEKLRKRLLDFETKAGCLIIAHFNQGAYVPTLGIPHISPVGGYDPLTDRVTILDVDPSQPAPYQIDFDTFYEGMASSYNPVFRHFGYKNGGYVWIRLR